jgi:hypothetical protein
VDIIRRLTYPVAVKAASRKIDTDGNKSFGSETIRVVHTVVQRIGTETKVREAWRLLSASPESKMARKVKLGSLGSSKTSRRGWGLADLFFV